MDVKSNLREGAKNFFESASETQALPLPLFGVCSCPFQQAGDLSVAPDRETHALASLKWTP